MCKISAMATGFRNLPSVDTIISDERISRLEGEYPRDLLVSLVRQQLEEERLAIASGRHCRSVDEIVASVRGKLDILVRLSLRTVVNASGVILHTNLGRAPLSAASLAAMSETGRGYSNLEFNLDGGTRGSRNVHLEGLLCQLTGAEAALVVNNNAAAVLLTLTALARRKEVIVSRGQAVEIGGGFRIPDVMRQSGARLVEVGTTNCTYAADFAGAITPRTAALLRVHSSNFRLVGFSHEVGLDELVALAGRDNLLVLDDLGSGCFLDTARYGLAPEPTVTQSVVAGVDVVTFSGDKLVGGPQAGIIVGKKQHLEKLKKHPLARALRIDKTRIAGLAVTLAHYLKGEAEKEIPVWRMMAAPLDDIGRRAAAWADIIGDAARVVDGETMVGGGSLPGGSLPTKLVAVSGGQIKGKKITAQSLARQLRGRDVPVIGRISGEDLLLDPRTVLPGEDGIVAQALRDIFGG
ncbi:L-seryl-tRNA(Sec) selenium transferase [Chloroflexota bacterium]